MATKSIPCRHCGNDSWEIYSDKAHCTNCRHTRDFTPRQAKGGGKAQKAKIERIKKYFSRGVDSLHKFTVEHGDYGHAYVNVETHKNILISSGGLFSVGPRGKVECLYVNDMIDDKKFRSKHWERQFRGV